MEQEQDLTNTAPAPDAPTPTPIVEATEQTGAAPAVDVKDRSAVIRESIAKVEKAKAVAENAAGRKFDKATGKYVPTKEQKPAPAASTTAPQAPASTQAPVAPAAVMNAPAGLTAAIKAQWGALPKHVQEELARLDRTAAEAAGKAAQPYAEKAKQADELNAVIAPYLPMIQAEGGTPARAIADLLRTAALLRTGSPQQKTHLFQQLAQQFGVQIQGPQTGGEAQQALPDISAHPLVQQLSAQVQQLSGHFTQQSMAQQQAQEQANAKAVQDFLGAVDAKGQPQYPLDNTLDDGFAAEISMTRQLHPDWDTKRVLENAYENLSWKAPQLRELRLQKQEEERKAKQAEELAKKQAASVSLKGSGPATTGSPSLDKKDRRAVIANAMSGLRS